MQGLPPLMQTTPGVTLPNFSREPLATEGEMTPGPTDENPFQDAREYRERLEMEKQARAKQDDTLMKTVPNPENPDLPPALIDKTPTQGNDPFVFDDVDDEVDNLSLPGLDGEMFRF